jgi:hypothetical protein
MDYLDRRILINSQSKNQFNGFRGKVIKEYKKRLQVVLEDTIPKRLVAVSKSNVRIISSAVVIRRVSFNRRFYPERKISQK